MRPSIEEYLLDLARTTAERSTCIKRSVGAVVADARNVVVATGYNGTPRGLPHCTGETPCDPEIFNCMAPRTYEVCLATHAEANALLAAGPRAVGGIIAVTCAPCRECAKLIVNAGLSRVIFPEYTRLFDDETVVWAAADILREGGVAVTFLSPLKVV